MDEHKEIMTRPVETTTTAPPPAQPSAFGCSKAIAVLGIAVLAFMAFLIHTCVSSPAEDVREFLRKCLESQGVVTISVEDESGRIVQMYSLYEKKIRVLERYKVTWMGSTKNIYMEGAFVCRYGVDASLSGVDALWESPDVIKVKNLRPSLISCELVPRTLKVESDDGVWNKLQPEDYQAAMINHQCSARRHASQDVAAMQLSRNLFVDLMRKGVKEYDDKIEVQYGVDQ
ncbi:MAG: hypothetical protein IKA55_04670 [Akkermansia sp.]|nr:hypothetical protein [Akkermansia sp.]